MPQPTPEQLSQWSESNRPTIYGVCAMFIFITNTAVLIRWISQWRVAKHFFVEDWAILVAVMISNIIAAVYLWAASQYGLGLHFFRVLDEKGPGAVVHIWQCLWVSAWLQGPLLLAVKISLLYLYKRIFLLKQTWLKWAWWTNLAFAVCWCIAATLYFILQCTPASYYWNQMYAKVGVQPPYPVHGTCGHGAAWEVGMPFVISLVSDIGILVLPMVTLFRLKMPLRRRLGLAVIFGMGLGACVCEVIRIWQEDTVAPKLSDPTYGSVTLVLINLAEPNIAILAACLPSIASQWRWTHEKLRSLASSRTSSTDGRSTIKSIPNKASLTTLRKQASVVQIPPSPSLEHLHHERSVPTGPGKYNANAGSMGGQENGTSTKDVDVELGRIDSLQVGRDGR